MFKSFNNFVNENLASINFFFDMDGVLADFEKGILDDKRYPEIKKAKNDLFSYVETKYGKEVSNVDEVKFMLGNGDQELKRLYDIAHDTVHEIADQKGFFINLDPLPGAEKLLKTAFELTGKLPDIATAPTDSIYCEPEKRAWMEKYFKGLFDKVYVDKKKEKLVKSVNDVLVDDRKKYVDAFTRAGGTAIRHYDVEDTINKMKTL